MNEKPSVATDPCPKCGGVLVERTGMFHWRGQNFAGLYCVPCNAGWDPNDRFIRYAMGAEPRGGKETKP